ncbi:hypothetical protein B1A99_15385 [Cohnella sp. CIP 111063]|uniref:glycosyltransferase n=1 Tax=unclassified Cohnella TaxID=2636738 RepID=UPI000B8C3E43|nr:MULTISPECIES: glycosyltransferase [unclassified Cohnella]OXS58011.1 hypothetical protein B1A99_15385 [Cohnella sp. CIP 111063]PRX71346.1 glycosyl transferase family 2 [Cohnella sp. SGD-V74]
MEKLKITIASPVRRDPDILAAFLNSLCELEAGGHELSFRFVDDNDDRESSDRLRAFQALQARKGISAKIEQADREAGVPFVCDENAHAWNERLVWRVAAHKDGFIREAIAEGADALFLLDSDVVVHPDTLLRLLDADRQIVSEIFWTQWQPGSRPLPQVWLMDEYEMAEREPGERLTDAEMKRRIDEFLAMLTVPGRYRVGGLGACMLIRGEALRAGVRFGKIRNLSFWWEDRHFCIRAECLGFGLFVDTTLPALHLYRKEDLDRLPEQRVHWANINSLDQGGRPRLLLSMVVRNEAEGHLREMLGNCRGYIDAACIIDDGSTDSTAEICREMLEGIPLRIVRNEHSRFHRENELRKQQWLEAMRLNPRWVLMLDADEWFEPSFAAGLPAMLEQNEIDVFSFRIYDFWGEGHYREDAHWHSHRLHRPLLVRYRPYFPFVWPDAPLHCGRMPSNIFTMPNAISSYRLKHMGWSREDARRRKYERYRELDPEGRYGSKAQYESILDPNPRLVEWME